MKILHTSDWHLGAYLKDKNNSRIPEQVKFINDLCEICDNKNIEMILIAGDIYDSYIPSSEAETLFFDAMEKLSNNRMRPVIVIAGNHDDPQRLTAANNMLIKNGVIVLGTPDEMVEDYQNDYFSIKGLGKCCFEVFLKGTGETAIIAAMPYPSEKRLNERLTNDDNFNEKDLQESYSNKIKSLFKEMSDNYRNDTVNLAMGHFYVLGGEISKGSERDISLGGSFAVNYSSLPENADYIALGHLHRPQSVFGEKAYYSGSPIAYSINESVYPKCVYIVDIDKSSCENKIENKIEKYLIECSKPLELWEFNSIDEAISFCKKPHKYDCFAYISIKTERPLYQNEIKEMREHKKDIVCIEAILNGELVTFDDEVEVFAEKTVTDEFSDFYVEEKGVKPPSEILTLFKEILQSTQDAENEVIVFDINS